MRYVVCYLCLGCSVVFVVFHLFTSGGAGVLLSGTCALGGAALCRVFILARYSNSSKQQLSAQKSEKKY